MKARARGALVGVGILLGLGVGGYWLWSTAPDRAGLPALWARAKQLGLPTTQSEFLGPELADERNAATELRQVIAQRDSMNSAALRRLTQGPPDNPADRPAWSGLQPGLDLAVQGSSKPAMRFARDWDMGFLVDFREFAALRDIARMLQVRAETRMPSDRQGALRDLIAARRIAGLTADSGSLIALLVGLSMEGDVVESYLRCLHQAEVAGGAAAVREMHAAFRAAAWAPDVRKAFLGEYYFQLATARNLSLYGGWGAFTEAGQAAPRIDPAQLRREGLPTPVRDRLATADMLRYWTAVFESPETGIELARHAESVRADLADTGSSYYEAMLPTFAGLVSGLQTLEARRTLLEGAVRLVERGLVGEGPKAWSTAVVGLKDPFDGAAIRVVQSKEGGVILYSLGPDGKDDGGLKSSTTGPRSDIALRYPPLPRPKPKDPDMIRPSIGPRVGSVGPPPGPAAAP